DLCQDVLLTVYKELSRFQHNGQPGAFRSWLRVITSNCARRFWRSRGRQPAAAGNDLFAMAEQLEDPASELRARWQQEHDQHVLQWLVHSLEPEFDPATLDAFRRLTLEGIPAPQLADELGLTIGTVYVFKSRVLRRLREEAQQLLD